MWSNKPSAAGNYRDEEGDKRLFRGRAAAALEPATSSSSASHSQHEIPLPHQYRPQHQSQQHRQQQQSHTGGNHPSYNTIQRSLTPTPSTTSDTTGTVTSSTVSKLLHPSYISSSHSHHHHHHHHENEGGSPQQQHISPTPFRPMPPREFALGSNLRRLYPTMPLPTTFPADTTTNTGAASFGDGGGAAAAAASHPRDDIIASASTGKILSKNNYGTTGGDGDGDKLIMGCISEEKNANDISPRSNPFSVHSGASSSALSVSLSLLDDGGVRRSRRSSMKGEMNLNPITSRPTPPNSTITRRISDDLVAKSSMQLLVESSMSLSVYEREIASERESAVLSGAVGGDAYKGDSSRRASSSLDNMLHPLPPLLDASSKHDASATSLLSSTGSKSRKIHHVESTDIRKRGRRTPNDEHQPPDHQRPLAINTTIEVLRGIPSNENQMGAIPESIIGDIDTPMSMSTISYHGGNDAASNLPTATARFGRLLQECRKLTETIGDDTILSNSSGVNSTSNSNSKHLSVDRAGGSSSSSVANHPSSTVSSSATPVSDSLKLRQSSGDSFAGLPPSNASSCRQSSKQSDSGQDSSKLRSMPYKKTPLRRDSLNNESILSDLSLGVDVMYGEVDGEVNKSLTAAVEDETASFNPLLLANTINTAIVEEGGDTTRLPAVENVAKLSSPEDKKDEIPTTRGREFRPREEDAHPGSVNSKGANGGDYSWLSYTTKDNNVDTPKAEKIKTKTSPLEDDEIRIPETSRRPTVNSSYTTDFSEDSGGLLVGFGHRRKIVGSEASSISSSDSSNSFSSDSDNSSSGSSGSSTSNSSSSESESDESSSLPAIARHGLQIPSSTDSQSDMVSALSFGGASTLMALQALKSSISPSSSTVVEREGNVPHRSPPGNMKLAETEPNARSNSDNAVVEPQRSTNDLYNQPSLAITRSRSTDAVHSMLEKLDEVSETNASFPDLAIDLPDIPVQNLFPHPAPSSLNSFAATNYPEQGEVGNVSTIPDIFSKSLPSQDTTSSAKPPPDLCAVDDVGHETRTDNLNCQSSNSNNFSLQKATSSSSLLSSPLANSCTHLSRGSNSSENVSRPAYHDSYRPLSGRSSVSRSSSSSNGHMQQVLSTEGGRQDAGIKTIESGRSMSSASIAMVDEEFAYSDSFVHAEARNLIVGVHENTCDEGNLLQKKQQGSGESPLENIKSNLNDDLSSVSSVVSRARNTFTRPVSAAANQTKDVNALNDNSNVSGRELYEDFPDLTRRTDELRKSSEVNVSSDSKSDIVIGNIVSSELECKSAVSADGRVTTEGQRKHFPFDMRSMRSGDDDNFIGDELYEDFPNMLNDGEMIVFQRNNSSKVLLANEETDWKKPWNTSTKTLPLVSSSNQGSDVNINLRSGSIASRQEREVQPAVDERSSDGSMALFESKQALENMGLYAAPTDVEDLETPAIEEDTQMYRKRLSRTSNASSSITEWDFSGHGRKPGALANESIDNAQALPPISSKPRSSLHSQSDEELELLESSQLDIVPSNMKAEEQFEHEKVNLQGKTSSVRTLAAASKKMTEMLQSSKLLRMQRQTKNDESFDDDSNSYCLSEKSAKTDVQSRPSERYPMEPVISSPFDSDEDEISAGDDRFQECKQEVESLHSAISPSVNKSLDGAFNESGNSMSLHMPRKGESIVGEGSSDDDESDEETQDFQSSKRTPQQRCKCQKSTLLLLVALLVPILIVAIVAGVVTKQLKKSSTSDSPSPTNMPTQPSANVIPSWTQVGSDMVGESSGDEAGFSISVSEDGSRAIIGARRNARDGLKNRGAARIFQYDANMNSFVPIWDVVGEAAGDQLGYSVSMARNGTRVAVGAIGSDKNGKNSGQVLIFDEDISTNTWILVHEMIGEDEYSLFGASVSFSQDGTKIIVGAPYHSEGADVTKSGRSYVYAEVNAEWMLLGEPMLGGSSNELFGWAVSISPNAPFVAVGAPLLEGSSGSGYAKVFIFQENEWQLYGEQMMLGGAGDRFGFSVSLAGDYNYQRIAIGAPGMAGNGEGSGLVSVYESDGSGSWQRSGDDLLGIGVGENFGFAVAMTSDATRMTVGVPNKKVEGVTVGEVHVVDITSDGLVSAGVISGRDGENFGASVSISHDGMLVYGGSPKTNLIRAFGEMYYQR